MQLPGIKAFNPEDYADAPDWFKDKFLTPLNQYIRGVGAVLNNGITVDANMAAQLNTVDLTVSDKANPYPFAFSWRFPQIIPAGCIIVRAETLEGPEQIRTAPQPKWSYTRGRIVIEAIRGDLEPGFRYGFTFYTFGK